MDEINWNLRKYTKEQFVEAWNEGSSLNEVSKILGIKGISSDSFSILKRTAILLELPEYPTGVRKDIKSRRWEINELFSIHENTPPCNDVLKKKILKHNFKQYKCELCDIDTWLDLKLSLHLDHINGNTKDNRLENLRFLCPNCHSQTETFGRGNSHVKIPSEPLNKKYFKSNGEVFVKGKKYNKNMRSRIINECLLPYLCSICDHFTYNGKMLKLQIDHIDGDKLNNELTNLRFLCPNCHSQTDTYCGRNIQHELYYEQKEPNLCIDCGSPTVVNGAIRCFSCHSKVKSQNVPLKEDLIQHLIDNGSKLYRSGEKYNVSDNAVKKWLIKYDIPYHSKELKKYLSQIPECPS